MKDRNTRIYRQAGALLLTLAVIFCGSALFSARNDAPAAIHEKASVTKDRFQFAAAAGAQVLAETDAALRERAA